MALIEIKIGGNAPQRTLQLLRSALEAIALGAIDGLPGTTPQVAVTTPAGAPARATIAVDVRGQLPDQTLADLANSSWETARTMLRRVTGRWSVVFNAPAQVRALANRSWDEDGRAYRWPEK